MSDNTQKSEGLVYRWGNFFIKKRRITLTIFLLIIGVGLGSLFGLTKEGFPDIKVPIVVVNIAYPGASPYEVESQVTEPLENELSAIEGVKTLSSHSANSFSSIVGEFEAGADFDKIVEEVKDGVDKARPELPEEAEDPEVLEISASGDFKILVAVAGDKSNQELVANAEKLKEKFDKISGISSVKIIGGLDREVVVEFDEEKLAKAGLEQATISQALSASNLNMPGGVLETDNEKVNIRVLGEFETVQELKDLVVGASRTGVVRLADVAEVAEAQVEPTADLRTGFTREGELDSQEAVFIYVDKKTLASITDVSDEVKAAIAEAEDSGELSEGVSAHIPYNESDFVEEQIASLITNGWQGLILVFIVLLVFINLRASLIVGTVIPLVMLIVFIVLSLLGLTLNIMVLFALILTLGMLVDNAIVVTEAIEFNLGKGLTRKAAVREALRQVGPPIVSATLTTVVVFIPMAMITGIMGEFIKFIPYTVIIALGGSLFVALTIIPFLGSIFLKEKSQEPKSWLIVRGYGLMMKKILSRKRYKLIVLLLALLCVGGSYYLPASGILDDTQWPEQDEDYMFVMASLSTGATLDQKFKVLDEIENKINQVPEIEMYFSSAGDGVDMASEFGGGDAQLYLTLDPDREKSSVDLRQELADEFADIEGAEVMVMLIGSGPPEEAYPVVVQLAGSDLEDLKKAAVETGDYLEGVEGVSKVEDGVTDNQIEEIQIVFDREKMAQRGFLVAEVANIIRAHFNEEGLGKFRGEFSENPREITLRFDESDRDELVDLKNLTLVSRTGEATRLVDMATINRGSSLGSIQRFDKERYVQIQAQVEDGVDPEQVRQKLDDYLTEEKLGEYNLDRAAVSYRGQFLMDMETFSSVESAFILAVFLIYLILVAQFNSFVQPAMILTAVPLALVGVFPALALFGQPLSFLAMIGIIALAGVVVNDAIIFLDTINRFRRDGFNLIKAIVEAGKNRLKPILSTTITTAGGILPLTITTEFWRGMGITIIAGLLTATVMTLVVIPVFYSIVVSVGQKFSRLCCRFTGKKAFNGDHQTDKIK